MIKKNQRTEKQLLNDERLRENFKKINEIQKEIVVENDVLPPPVMLGRVRTRKIFYTYDLIENHKPKI